ncbi:MAG: LPS export ABC transporter permease LptG [Psittacicella sp.]
MNIINKHIIKTVFPGVLGALIFLLAIAFLANFISQLNLIGKGNYTVEKALLYSLLELANFASIFLPIAVLIGVVLRLGSLSASSELTVMQASGKSKISIIFSVVQAILPFLIISIAISQWGVPQINRYATKMYNQAIFKNSHIQTNNFWEKQGNTFIYVGGVNNNNLEYIRTYTFNNNHELISKRLITYANYKGNNNWEIHNYTTYNITPTKVTKIYNTKGMWRLNLKPKDLMYIGLEANQLSITNLYRYANYLKSTNQSYKSFYLSFWQELANPLSIIVMMLLGVSFVFGSLRSVGVGLRIVLGILVGFLFYVVNSIFGLVSLVYGFNAIASSFLPSLIVLGISIYLLLREN